MKKSFLLTAIIFTGIMATLPSSCSKRKQEECKICKALPLGPDQPPVEKKICSSAEEDAFRADYAGRTIVCH